jgi:hypothetical protein
MKIKYLKLIFLSALIPILGQAQSGADSIKSDIRLRTFVENEEVPLNREVVFHVELEWKGDLNKYKISEFPEPVVSNLTMRGSGSSNKVNSTPQGGTYSIKRRTFYFRPLEIGMAYIEGVLIKYDDTYLHHQESLISDRVGVKIVDPIPEADDMLISKTWLYGVLILIVLSVSLFFYLRYRQRKKEERLQTLAIKKESVEEKYIRLLKETIHFNTDNIKDSLSDLSHLLNGYFSEKFHFPTANLATENLIEVLQEKGLSEETISRLNDFYKTANLVKFAGESVSDSDFHRLYDTVELILENQKVPFSEGEEE